MVVQRRQQLVHALHVAQPRVELGKHEQARFISCARSTQLAITRLPDQHRCADVAALLAVTYFRVAKLGSMKCNMLRSRMRMRVCCCTAKQQFAEIKARVSKCMRLNVQLWQPSANHRGTGLSRKQVGK